MKKVVLIVSIAICSIAGYAQSENITPYPKVNPGFSIGQNYSILHANSLNEGAKIMNGYGFSLGVFLDYNVSSKFIIAPQGELSFNGSRVISENSKADEVSYLSPISVDFMTHFVYKLGTGKNRPYILAGPNIKLPLSEEPRSKADYNKKANIAVDFGVGLEHLFKKVTVAPELRYSLGITNFKDIPEIESAKQHAVSLVFSFK